jgi:hypothetical protein
MSASVSSFRSGDQSSPGMVAESSFDEDEVYVQIFKLQQENKLLKK